MRRLHRMWQPCCVALQVVANVHHSVRRARQPPRKSRRQLWNWSQRVLAFTGLGAWIESANLSGKSQGRVWSNPGRFERDCIACTSDSTTYRPAAIDLEPACCSFLERSERGGHQAALSARPPAEGSRGGTGDRLKWLTTTPGDQHDRVAAGRLVDAHPQAARRRAASFEHVIRQADSGQSAAARSSHGRCGDRVA